jgi:hypothetical protein
MTWETQGFDSVVLGLVPGTQGNPNGRCRDSWVLAVEGGSFSSRPMAARKTSRNKSQDDNGVASPRADRRDIAWGRAP